MNLKSLATLLCFLFVANVKGAQSSDYYYIAVERGSSWSSMFGHSMIAKVSPGDSILYSSVWEFIAQTDGELNAEVSRAIGVSVPYDAVYKVSKFKLKQAEYRAQGRRMWAVKLKMGPQQQRRFDIALQQELNLRDFTQPAYNFIYNNCATPIHEIFSQSGLLQANDNVVSPGEIKQKLIENGYKFFSI